MQNREQTIDTKRAGSEAVVGLLLGLGAALVAVKSPIMPWLVNVPLSFVSIGFAWALLSADADTIKRLRVTAIDILFVTYLALKFVVEVYNSTNLEIAFAGTTWFDLAFGYFALLAARIVIRSPEGFWRFLLWFSIPASFVAIIAVLQIINIFDLNRILSNYVHSEGLETRLDKGWATRATSTIGHWTALGGYLCAITALVGCRMIRNSSLKISNTREYLMLAILLLGQFATLTFATIAVAVAISLFIFLRIGVRIQTLIVLAFCVGFTWIALGSLVTSRVNQQANEAKIAAQGYSWLPESVGFRLNVWFNESIPAALERPLTGWGIAAYRYIGTGRASDRLIWISPESEWIRTVVSSGFIILALEMALVWVVWRTIASVNRATRDHAVEPILIFYIGLILASFIHSHLSNRGVPLALWSTVGAVLALAELSRSAQSLRPYMNAGADRS